MNSKHIIMLVAIVASTNVLSCSNKNDAAPQKKTQAELLSQAPWHWTNKQLAKGDGAPVEQPLADVQKSAVYTFKSDGSFTIVGNADGSTTIGTWAIVDTKTLTITTKDDEGKPIIGSISFTVSETTLVMTTVGTFYSTNGDGSATTWDTQINTFAHL